MRLRSHLQILTVGTLLPVVLFGMAATAVIAERERNLVRRGGTERTLALMTAVDAELDGYLKSLQALAGSSALAQNTLDEFHVEARRALRIEPGWITIRLARPDGTVVLDALRPRDAALSDVTERPSFEQAAERGRSSIRDLYPESDGRHLFGVRTPVETGDSVRYVLSALINPAEIHGLLERQRLPEDWVGVVLDANHRIVARTMASDSTVGRLASVNLRDALAERPEGWFRGETLEGIPVYTPYTRSLKSGWTVALGIAAAGVDAGAAEVGWIFAAGIIAAILAAILLANGLSRRIVRPIGSLASAARAIGRGEPVQPPTRAGVREVREVSHVLARAADKVREREAALRAADRGKDEFLAMLGHELRNPLSALTAAAEILHLSGTSEDGPARRAAEVIDRQVRHMTRLVDDLLDVSRVTTGKVNLELAPLDLGETVRSVLQTFEAGDRLSRHGVDVDVRPVWIRADQSRIEQIASNLIGNALKYTPPGGRISVRVSGTSQPGSDAVLEVDDDGAGMSSDLAPRVFDSFVQGDRSLDREAGGLGLGLTLVKNLVERHGGTVEAFSEGPGRGARFTVRLPAISPPTSAEPATDVRQESTVETAGGRSHRVLVIEDNEDARETLTVALEFLGHEVLAAADGETGLALVRQEQPDVAVIDIGLPRMNGFEVARRLRSRRGGGREEAGGDAVEAGAGRAGAVVPATEGNGGRVIRLVALTGYSQEETRARAEAAGFDRSLTKPVGMHELARVIDELMTDSSNGG